MVSQKSFFDEYLHKFNQNLGNASSLEQCVLLEYITKYGGFNSVLDTGAGISSCFIRKAMHDGQVIHTYETKLDWVSNIQIFLTQHELNSDNIFHVFDDNNMLLDEYIKNDIMYDFIYHDMGCVEERIQTLPYVLQKLQKGGYILLDDMQFGYNVNSECNLLATTNMHLDNVAYEFIHVKDITLDAFGRFAHLYKKI